METSSVLRTGTGYAYPPPESDEVAALALLNRDRARFQVPPLRMSYRLCFFADAHSQQMADKGSIFHSTPEQLDQYAGPAFNLLGENVGAGDSIVNLNLAFMASYHHRINITNRRFSIVGIGNKSKNGVIFATHIFWG